MAVARVRGAARVLSALLDQFESDSADDVPLRVAIAHAQAPEQADGARERGTRPPPARGDRAAGDRSAPVVGTYGGPGTIGLLWVAEPRPGAATSAV